MLGKLRFDIESPLMETLFLGGAATSTDSFVIPERRNSGIPFGCPKFQNKSTLFMLRESIYNSRSRGLPTGGVWGCNTELVGIFTNLSDSVRIFT